MKKPKNWDLFRDGKKGFLKYKGEIVHIFPTVWSQKFRLFEYLFNNLAVYISYKELCESALDRPYPPKGRRARLNQNIQRQVNILKKDLSHLPIYFSTDYGEAMVIKNS